MVETGLQVLIAGRGALLAERRVGVVSHAAAVLPDLTGIVDGLLGAGVRVSALFGPEHGFDAAAADGAAVADRVDTRTGLPVYSLYGATQEPTPAMLAEVDVLLFDMQDVGVRFYTFISTLVHLLRAAARAGMPVVVLDRPNPINGCDVEGPLVAPGYESFVGIMRLPVRHGLTMGELARFANGELGIGADLTVVPMRGWQRPMWFDETSLPWVPTSPAIPHLLSAIIYPGTCLLEGTNLSEGRGTALPFEVCGAPWLDGYRLAATLNARGLPGVRFRPVTFSPTASKHAGEVCRGVQLHVTDRSALRPLAAAVHLIAACRAQSPERFRFLPPWQEGQPSHFDRLAGSAALREALLAEVSPDEIVAGWAEDEAEFREARKSYLLY